MNLSEDRLAFLVAMLLVVASALYAIGTAIEHSQRTKEHHAERQLAASSQSSGETTNKTTTDEKATTETTPETTTPAPETTESGGEKHGEKIKRDRAEQSVERTANPDEQKWTSAG